MYKDIFESIRNEAEKRNLRERTIQLYCSDVSYFLRWIGKNVSDLTLEDAESFLTAKRLEGRSPETHNHYRSAIKFLYKKVLQIRSGVNDCIYFIAGQNGRKITLSFHSWNSVIIPDSLQNLFI